MSDSRCEAWNAACHLAVEVKGRDVLVRLTAVTTGLVLSDGAYVYRASRSCTEGQIVDQWLQGAAATQGANCLNIAGRLAGLDVQHTFRLYPARGILDEQVVLHNSTDARIELTCLALGMTHTVSDEVGHILSNLQADRMVAIPFRHRPPDPDSVDVDLKLADLIRRPGREHRANRGPLSWPRYGYVPSMQWASEGWALEPWKPGSGHQQVRSAEHGVQRYNPRGAGCRPGLAIWWRGHGCR